MPRTLLARGGADFSGEKEASSSRKLRVTADPYTAQLESVKSSVLKTTDAAVRSWNSINTPLNFVMFSILMIKTA
jgi:hypothetical protein